MESALVSNQVFSAFLATIMACLPLVFRSPIALIPVNSGTTDAESRYSPVEDSTFSGLKSGTLRETLE